MMQTANQTMWTRSTRAAWASALLALCACGGDEGGGEASSSAGSDATTAPGGASTYALASVVINPDGNRTTYVQTTPSLDVGPFHNQRALEIPGNGNILATSKALYAGLAEEPTWVRYAVDETGALRESKRVSFLSLGASRIDYGNVIVDEQTAVSVLTSPPMAVVWDPSEMVIRGKVDLGFLARDGYELEVWTTTSHNGLVYIPGRLSDWTGNRIFPSVSTTLLDPKALQVLGTAVDDRCASGGQVVFDAQGYAYVMGDGRNHSIQMFANVSGQKAPDNCLLRIAPGTTEFEKSYHYTLRSLTGGLESISELETAVQGSGVAFAKMFYPDKLPPDVKPVDFGFWSVPAHKLWRIELGDPPTAREVDGLPFSAIGFKGAALEGRFYSGESPDGKTSDVYETDPATNKAVLRFKMDGYFNGLYKLSR